MWGGHGSFPRAILHVDGDSFFASCEIARDPKLRGKPVITGRERGIVSAMTYDVKARGVKRGMILSEARKICPDAVILPSDYETYSLFSERMYEIVRRYTPTVEEYSIDECFADITGLRRLFHMSYEKIAEKTAQKVRQHLEENRAEDALAHASTQASIAGYDARLTEIVERLANIERRVNSIASSSVSDFSSKAILYGGPTIRRIFFLSLQPERIAFPDYAPPKLNCSLVWRAVRK